MTQKGILDYAGEEKRMYLDIPVNKAAIYVAVEITQCKSTVS